LFGLLAFQSSSFLLDNLIFADLDPCEEACPYLEDIIDKAVAGLLV
jgi:hypothetical protein